MSNLLGIRWQVLNSRGNGYFQVYININKVQDKLLHVFYLFISFSINFIIFNKAMLIVVSLILLLEISYSVLSKQWATRPTLYLQVFLTE